MIRQSPGVYKLFIFTVVCASKEEINKIFDSAKIWVSFMDKMLDQYKYGNPFNGYLKILEYPFNGPNTSKRV